MVWKNRFSNRTGFVASLAFFQCYVRVKQLIDELIYIPVRDDIRYAYKKFIHATAVSFEKYINEEVYHKTWILTNLFSPPVALSTVCLFMYKKRSLLLPCQVNSNWLKVNHSEGCVLCSQNIGLPFFNLLHQKQNTYKLIRSQNCVKDSKCRSES